MGFAQTLRYLHQHPLAGRHYPKAVARFVLWQIRSRVSPGPHRIPFVGRSVLMVTRGMTGATGNVYAGLHEFEDMGFVLHALRPDDLFVDVGANIGSYTVLAASVCGARVCAYEPVAGTFEVLRENVRANGIESHVETRQAAVGATAGTVRFTTAFDTVNHVAIEGEEGVDVPVVSLDEEMEGLSPVVMKVDVEGFETEVVEGMNDLLASPRAPRAILVELIGAGERYAHDEARVARRLEEAGYVNCTYEPFTRTLRPTPKTTNNTLFVRDVEAMQARLQSASPFEVWGQKI